MTSARLVYCTFPNASEAEAAARAIVEAKLAACVNIVASVRSIYRWEGQVCSEEECMIIAKTEEARFDELAAMLLALHSYDCPEIIAVPIASGNQAYLQWITDETKPA